MNKLKRFLFYRKYVWVWNYDNMNKLKRFCFKPQGKDHLWWVWIDAVSALLFIALIVMTCHKFGRWTWVCSLDTCFFLINLGFCWLNSTLYDEWKKKQPPD